MLEAPRTSLVSANKEGIVSLLGTKWYFFISCHSVLTQRTGYLAIHVLGLSVGTIILAPTPSFFSRRRKALFDKDGKRSSVVLD